MKRNYTLLLCIQLVFQLYVQAQEGNIFISNYEINEAYSDTRVRSIAFDNYSTVLLASRKGVAFFDGKTWGRVQNIPANVLTIIADSSAQTIYTGLKDEFGYITRDINGTYKYTRLKQLDENTGEFSHIIITANKVYFYSNTNIFIVNKEEYSRIDQVKTSKNGEYIGVFARKENIYINLKGTGVCKLEGNELSPLSSGVKFSSSRILFSTTCNKINVLIGTDENILYLFNGKDFVQFSERTQIRDFLKENILWNGIDFSQDYFAITTLTGGCVIIDKVYGKIKFSINYMTGLPDDEIFAFSKDKNNSLWFSHEHGLSSCDLKLPVMDYTPYPGIYGNINDVLLKNKRVYVATNNGVYILSEIKNLKEKEILIKQKSRFGYDFIPKKTYILQSIDHKFLQVKNLTEKCKQLYDFKGRTLAISDFGLYEISDSIAQPLIQDIFINSLCADKDTNVLYAATLNGLQLLTNGMDSVVQKPVSKKKKAEKPKSNWKKKLMFANFAKPIYSVVQDKQGNLIFGTEGKAYFCKKDSLLAYAIPLEIKLPEKINEPINVIRVVNEIFFVQSAGIFVYSSASNSVTYQNKQDFEKRDFRFVSGYANTMVFKDNSWVSLDSTLKFINKNYLNLFSKIRKVYPDEEGNTWIINGKKELVKILTDTSLNKTGQFQVSMLQFTDKLDSSYSLNKPVLEYERNAVKILLSAPFRLNPEETQYRYKVRGLKNYEEWSNWSANPIIELSFIPAGKYTLIVNARNILGQTSNEQQLEFTVLKPFWQTNTFYYSVGGGMLALILLIIYLSRLRLKRKNKILEIKVRERTIELQMEKDKTEELLLNILPKETADELKLYNKVTPRHYDLITVLFTDFKGFTMIAEKMTPTELVHEIDYCFREFDRIIGRYQIEKIKTIGDAYMCAGGLPKEYKNHAVEVIKAALEIRDFMLDYKERCTKENKPCFEIRIGLHTGKVVAGVVGIKKYAYDIWGDTVNIASRMESSGEPGKINISGDTYELVKKNFNCTHRGKILAKNKGEIDMYFVDSLK